MPFLKKKINLKQDFLDDEGDLTIKIEATSTETIKTEPDSSEQIVEWILPTRKPRQRPPCPEGDSKNIVKNYGKAMCSFACSKIAIPYLKDFVAKKGWRSERILDFVEYIKSKKEDIIGIEGLRKLLVGNEKDSYNVKVYKKLFQEISIVFLKYFSVNWIFGGKLTHKTAHLKFRFKMLRRIQDPEHFTYLKTSAR